MRSWLVDLRRNKGLSQSAVAKEVGIKQPSYHLIETGKTDPRPATAKKIAKVLGFDWKEFYN